MAKGQDWQSWPTWALKSLRIIMLPPLALTIHLLSFSQKLDLYVKFIRDVKANASSRVFTTTPKDGTPSLLHIAWAWRSNFTQCTYVYTCIRNSFANYCQSSFWSDDHNAIFSVWMFHFTRLQMLLFTFERSYVSTSYSSAVAFS